MTAKLIRIATAFADALDKSGQLSAMDRAELDSAIRDEEALHGEHARMTAAIVAALVYESDHVDTPEKAPDGDDFNEVMEPLRALLDDRTVFLPAEKPNVFYVVQGPSGFTTGVAVAGPLATYDAAETIAATLRKPGERWAFVDERMS